MKSAVVVQTLWPMIDEVMNWIKYETPSLVLSFGQHERDFITHVTLIDKDTRQTHNLRPTLINKVRGWTKKKEKNFTNEKFNLIFLFVFAQITLNKRQFSKDSR